MKAKNGSSAQFRNHKRRKSYGKHRHVLEFIQLLSYNAPNDTPVTQSLHVV